MRKIIATEFMSLDDVFEAPGGGENFKYEGWTFPYMCEEFQKFKMAELDESDALLLGRVTYDGFATSWPERSGDPFSDKFNAMPKYVVSNSLKKATWNNSHILSENVVGQIEKLEGTLYIHGSGKLVRFLMKHNLVDQVNILLYPVVLGEGKQLFKDAEKKDLKLVESEKFSSGIVKLIYVPKH